MLNYSRQFVRKYNIEIICLIFLFWAPHIGLDYIFDSEGGEKLQLPNGQYAKNRERSKNINNAFMAKIEQIKENVLFKNVTKRLPSFPDHYHTGLV